MKTKFNKRFFWMLAAILTLCGAVMFTSCSKDDDDEKTTESPFKGKLTGKWMQSEIDGRPALTDEKSVMTFISDTKATISSSKNTYSASNSKWNAFREYAIETDGSNLKLTSHPNETTTLINQLNVSSFTDNEIICKYTHITSRDGQENISIDQNRHYVKITVDYKDDVIGLWECTGLSGIETYNDANARLEFATDGTYKYWQKNDFNVWNAVTTREFQNYFVDGTLLATRWKDQGDAELREWWEIESITNDEMTWKALRQNEEGENVVQRMTWKKVGS